MTAPLTPPARLMDYEYDDIASAIHSAGLGELHVEYDDEDDKITCAELVQPDRQTLRALVDQIVLILDNHRARQARRAVVSSTTSGGLDARQSSSH